MIHSYISVLGKNNICKLAFDLGNGSKVTKTKYILRIEQDRLTHSERTYHYKNGSNKHPTDFHDRENPEAIHEL